MRRLALALVLVAQVASAESLRSAKEGRFVSLDRCDPGQFSFYDEDEKRFRCEFAQNVDEVINLADYAFLGGEGQIEAIRAALRPYLDGGGLVIPNVLIRGTFAETTEADLDVVQVRDLGAGTNSAGPYAVGIMECPSEHYTAEDLPVADGTTFNMVSLGSIHWDNVVWPHSCAGQTVDHVLLERGCEMLNGHESVGSAASFGGQINRAPSMSGSRTFLFDGDCDAGLARGDRAFRRDTSSLFDADGPTVVAELIDGAAYSDMTNLTSACFGDEDWGVMCHWANHAGSNAYGPIFSGGVGVGRFFTGSVLSDYDNPNLIGNAIDDLYGDLGADGTFGCDLTYYASCVAGTLANAECIGNDNPHLCCSGAGTGTCAGSCASVNEGCNDIHTIGGTIEGGGVESLKIAAPDWGSRNLYVGTHVEGPDTSLENHTVLFGACRCGPAGARAGRWAGTAADCPGTTLICVAAPTSVSIRFLGGLLPGDDDSTSGFDGTFIGAGADTNGLIELGTTLGGSTNNSGVKQAFGFAVELTGNTIPRVDVTRAERVQAYFWPAYPQLQHAFGVTFQCATNIASGFDPTGASNYLPCGTYAGTAGVAVTDLAALPWTLPWNNIFRWQLHRIDAGVHTAHTGDEDLNVEVVCGDYNHTDLKVFTDGADAAEWDANPVAAKTRFGAAFEPTSSSEISPSNETAVCGLRLTGTGDESKEHYAVTFFPLK